MFEAAESFWLNIQVRGQAFLLVVAQFFQAPGPAFVVLVIQAFERRKTPGGDKIAVIAEACPGIFVFPQAIALVFGRFAQPVGRTGQAELSIGVPCGNALAGIALVQRIRHGDGGRYAELGLFFLGDMGKPADIGGDGGFVGLRRS